MEQTNQAYSNRNMIFPVKLNPDLRYQICLKIALGFSTPQVRAWLKEQGVDVSYQGVRKYWVRRRWVELTASLRSRIHENAEARQMLLSAVRDGLEKDQQSFDRFARELLDQIRRVQTIKPDLSGRFYVTGRSLVEKFNKTVNRTERMIKALS